MTDAKSEAAALLEGLVEQALPCTCGCKFGHFDCPAQYREAVLAIIQAERAALLRRIEDKAREWAAHYDQGSDGRNTFVMFAEWIKELKP